MPTILCIDDHRPGLATRKVLLESKGYSVLTAEDGTTGLSLLRTRHDVDAVVLDSRMPGMDGEAVGIVISNEMPDLPIVVLTGYPAVPPPLAALADAVVMKGEPPQVLLDALARLTATKPEKPSAISRTIEEATKLVEEAKAIRSETRSLVEGRQRQAG